MRFDASALTDLDDIYEYVAADSVTSADALLEVLLDGCSAIDGTPGIGHRRQDLTAQNVLFWSVRGYVIVYRRLKSEVQVVAVTEGSQDIRRLLRRRFGPRRLLTREPLEGSE